MTDHFHDEQNYSIAFSNAHLDEVKDSEVLGVNGFSEVSLVNFETERRNQNLNERVSMNGLQNRRISQHMRGLGDLHQSRIEEEFTEEVVDTLDSQRTMKAEV